MFTAIVWTGDTRSLLTTAYQAATPREFAAVLGGRMEHGTAYVERVLILPNTADADDSFCVDTAAFAHCEHELRKTGHGFLGFAHSHVDGFPAPSQRDREQLWTGCLQVIVKKQQVNTFVLDANRNVHPVATRRDQPARRVTQGAQS